MTKMLFLGISILCGEKDYGLIQKKIFYCKMPFLIKMRRLFLNILFFLVPLRVQFVILNVIKRSRNKNVYISPGTFFISHLIKENKVQIQPKYASDKKFFIGLTFDIDNKMDFKYLPYFLDYLTGHNISATVNVLTHSDYQISLQDISDIRKKGHEIGLHGDTHNSALAFLPKKIIRCKLQRAIEKLGFVPYGFRSPALSFSDSLIEVLDDLGFVYDSSLTTGIAMYKSIEFPYAFRYKNSRIIEIPLFMQDYNFFVNNCCTEEETIAVFRKQIEELSMISGLAIINVHPSIIVYKKRFWYDLIDMLISYRSKAYISTLYELLKFVQ